MKKNEPTTQPTEKKLSSIGVRKVPMKLKDAFVQALIDEKVGQQSLFLIWIVKLVVARPKKFIQMCRDLEKEIEAELTTK
ncbi:hypothetical protein [Bernardetia sp. MNP-M8]|uniref:hypothetical protein n=1 Tax=Bernardetia sp. MNP-M8 TaxID=3127470 RepID=UPI0030D5C8E3